MGMRIGSKLNCLQRDLPEGLVVDANWLERRGYSSALRSKYAAHGWLEQVARGVYRRPTATLPSRSNKDELLSWHLVGSSLQTVLDRRFIVGGRTALEWEGFAHYHGAAELREVHLYGNKRPPAWIAKLKPKTKSAFHKAKKLFKPEPSG